MDHHNNPIDLNLQIDSLGSVKRIGGAIMEQPFDPTIPVLLPHEAMYKIQVGSKLFEISGASLSSDGPSYFTECFSKQHSKRQQSGYKSSCEDRDSAGASPSEKCMANNVLFIDRSAEVFEIIYKHLQGYFVDIKDEVQYTMLYADAMYYNLPRLRCILKEYEYYFANINGTTFKVAKNLFCRNGDSPNYFVMTYAALYADVEQVFLSKKLIRPPPQSAPYLSRSPEFFQEILNLLGGAAFDLDDTRREALIKECRYYRFLNLEQRLIKCRIKYNPLTKSEDILLSLQDINKKKLEFPACEGAKECYPAIEASQIETPGKMTEGQCEVESDSSSRSCSQPAPKRIKISHYGSDTVKYYWHICTYKRPYLDEHARDLIFQIDSMESILIFNKRNKIIHVALTNETARQFESVFQPVLSQIGIDLSKFKVVIKHGENTEHDGKHLNCLVLPACISICDLRVNSIACPNIASVISDKITEQVIDFTNMQNLSYCPGKKLYLVKSLWKLGVNNGKIMMIALRAEAFHGTKEYSRQIEYL